MSQLSDEQLEGLLAKLGQDAKDHRKGHGISRTVETAHERVDATMAECRTALAARVQQARFEAATGLLRPASYNGMADLLAAVEITKLVHAALDKPPTRGNAEVLSDYTRETWQSKAANLEHALDEVAGELQRREAEKQLAAAEKLMRATEKPQHERSTS